MNKRLLLWTKWVEKGIYTIGDLHHPDGSKKNSDELHVNWLDLKCLWENIPKEWKSKLEGIDDNETCEDQLLIELKTCKLNRNKKIYEKLVSDQSVLFKYANRWLERGLVFDLDRYITAFNSNMLCNKIIKYRDFQYRLLLGKIVLNVDLYAWGIIETDKCEFCKRSTETMTHIFYDCDVVKPFLNYFYELCAKCGEFNQSKEDFLFNLVIDNANSILNFVSVLLKQFLYVKRCTKECPRLPQFIAMVELYQNIEFSTARTKNTVDKHVRRWSPIFAFQ